MSELMQKTKNNQTILEIGGVLKKILSENSEVEQCFAVQALGKLPLDNSVKILIEHLRNPDEDVRCDTGKALAILQDKSAIEPLIENLIQDPIGEAKIIYIEALQALKATQASDILSTLVGTRGEEENVAWEEDGSGWDDWLSVQNAAIVALGSFGTDIDVDIAIKAILKALDDPMGQDVWALATKTLTLFGEAGISTLIELMKNASHINRKRIIIALGGVDDAQSAILLEAAMSDPKPSVRIAAITSGAKRNIKEICTIALNDGSIDVRVKALQTYSNFDDKTLATALNDSAEKVQIAACEAIIKDKKTRPILKLINLAQKQLRNGSDQILAASILAMAVAKPDGAVNFIEDIVNHNATEPSVRIASLRALGSLNSSKSVALLSEAAGDASQEIRLAAIGSLGKISKTKGALADKAVEILTFAISGDLVATPKDWKPKEDNIIDFKKQKNLKQEERDQDSRMVKLDREGNIIEASKHPKIEETAQPEVEIVKEKSAPLSTLDAIMAANSEIPLPEEDTIEIDEKDIAFLEMTGVGSNKRKKINPQSKTPAHLDVRKLAALVGCETAREELLEPLIKAAGESEQSLSEAAIDGILVLAQNGIDISPAQRILLRHATTSEVSLSFRAIRALAFIKTSVVSKVITKLTNDKNDIVRSEALKASNGRKIEVDLADLCVNSDRLTRIAAAELIACQSSKEAVPSLFGFAFVEDGVHKQKAAILLKSHEFDALKVTLDLINSEQARERLIGLDVLNSIL